MGKVYNIGYNSVFTETTVLTDGTPWLKYYYTYSIGPTGAGNYTEYLITNVPGARATVYPGGTLYRVIVGLSVPFTTCIGRLNTDNNKYLPQEVQSVYDASYNLYVTDIGHTAEFSSIDLLFEPYASQSEALAALSSQLYPITYRLTNCTAPNAPTEAATGSNVVVPLVFPDGYGIANSSDIYVTNNGVVIPSQYSNGTLTFTMP